MDYISYNGEISKKPQIPLDQGFLYGYGVFETINVAQGNPVFFNDHMERLKQSALVMSLKLTSHPEQIWTDCLKIIAKNEMERGGLRVTMVTERISPSAAAETASRPSRAPVGTMIWPPWAPANSIRCGRGKRAPTDSTSSGTSTTQGLSCGFSGP